MKYGYCTNHPKTYARNSRGLCSVCSKERREYSAASKGIITKSAKAKIEEDEFDISRGFSEENTGKLGESEPASKGSLFRPIRAFSSKDSSISKIWTPKQKTKIKPRSEKNKAIVAQELLMFKQIWEERPHFCEVTGRPIRFFHPACFSHVLAKGAYPRFRLYKKNIVLCLVEWHHKWEFETRKTLELSWIETLESALKTEYYKK